MNTFRGSSANSVCPRGVGPGWWPLVVALLIALIVALLVKFELITLLRCPETFLQAMLVFSGLTIGFVGTQASSLIKIPKIPSSQMGCFRRCIASALWTGFGVLILSLFGLLFSNTDIHKWNLVLKLAMIYGPLAVLVYLGTIIEKIPNPQSNLLPASGIVITSLFVSIILIPLVGQAWGWIPLMIISLGIMGAILISDHHIPKWLWYSVYGSSIGAISLTISTIIMLNTTEYDQLVVFLWMPVILTVVWCLGCLVRLGLLILSLWTAGASPTIGVAGRRQSRTTAVSPTGGVAGRRRMQHLRP